MIPGVHVRTCRGQGADSFRAGPFRTQKMQRRAAFGVLYIGFGAEIQQQADPPAVAVVGVMVEQGASAHLLVDVPTVTNQQVEPILHRLARDMLQPTQVGIGAPVQ